MLRQRRLLVALGTLVVVSTTGCGSRLSRSEVLSAARAANVGADGGQPGAAAPGPGQPATSDAVGNAAPVVSGTAASPVGGGATAVGQGSATAPSGSVAGGKAARSSAAAAGSSPAAGAAPAQASGNAPRSSTPPPAPSASSGGAGAAPAPAQGAAPTPEETGPIVIASVGNYSGAPGVAQAPIAKAVQVWAAATNRAGGLLGRAVKLIVVDDGSDPARHVAALRDLVENQHIVALVGDGATLTAASGKDYLEKMGVPEIGNECTTPGLYWQSPIFFPTCADHPDQMYGLAKTARDFTGESKVAFLYCQEAQICKEANKSMITDGLAKQGGLDVVYQAQISLVQPDFTSECLNAKNAGAKLMIAIITPDGLARIASSCARQGYKPTFVQWAATTLADSNTKPGLENMVLQTLAHPFASTAPAVGEFHQAFSTFADKPGGPPEILGWASSKLFQLAATRAAAAAHSISSKTILDALHTVSGETLGGLTTPMTFPAGKPVQNAPC
ncbi:MAG TPA: ABC transporter substrate-binding protein, partial [Acidimicrobiia bacterium]|nr:ABC transporter substrate-binding protein [Acidimicrobiia bacterium]